MSVIFARKCVFLLLCFGLVACAPAREFHSVPQEGANRSGTYPRFSDRPQAETTQFTAEESRHLTARLDETRQNTVTRAGVPPQRYQNAAVTRARLRRDVEETLKAIEQGEATAPAAQP